MRLPILELIETFDQAEEMRILRNSVRDLMTRNKSRITRSEQEQWFNGVYLPLLNQGSFQAFLFKLKSTTLGYGIISYSDSRWWVTGVLSSEYRGRGLGKFLFTLLINRVFEHSDEVWLEVLNTNERAYQLYLELGFEVIENNSDVLVLRKVRA